MSCNERHTLTLFASFTLSPATILCHQAFKAMSEGGWETVYRVELRMDPRRIGVPRLVLGEDEIRAVR